MRPDDRAKTVALAAALVRRHDPMAQKAGSQPREAGQFDEPQARELRALYEARHREHLMRLL